jgi:hypothetical protein
MMEIVYTETTLRRTNKAGLLEIAATIGAGADASMSNSELIAFILNADRHPDKATDADVDVDSGNRPSVIAQHEVVMLGATQFSKEALMASPTYSHRRNELGALLEDEQRYTHMDVQRLLMKHFNPQ